MDAGKPLVNVGLIYRSQATLHLEGQFLANGGIVADARTTLVLPQIITGGVALWPVRDQDHEWKLQFDLDYTGWKSVRNTDVHLSNGLTIPVDPDWRSSFTPMMGTEYKWLRPERLPGWAVTLRVGYFFSQAPIPDRTFSPGVPDADCHAISFGVGLFCKTSGTILGLIQCGQIHGHPPQAQGDRPGSGLAELALRDTHRERQSAAARASRPGGRHLRNDLLHRCAEPPAHLLVSSGGRVRTFIIP